jgi:GDP-L-fucose synthase
MSGKDLITGASGLVGSALMRLTPSIREIIGLNRNEIDLTDFSETLTMMEKVHPERVFHAAAAVGGLGANMRHPGEMFRKNILINFNIMEAARLTGVKRLISFMSTCVYPNQISYPIQAQALHLGPPHPSNFAYAHAKRMQDIQAKAYRIEYGCNFITAVGPNLFGINDNFNLNDGHAVASIIHKTFLAKKDATDLVIWGSGKPLREFVFADDIARLSYWALENYQDAEPLMFSNGIETSIRELVELIAQKIGFQGRIVFDDSKPDGQYRKPSDISKLRELNPHFQFTPLSEALDKTIEWFIKAYPQVRM